MGELKVNCVKIRPPKDGLYQGVFVGDNVSEWSIEDFAKMSGTDVDIALKFLAFGTGLDFPAAEATLLAEKGGAIFIKLEPWSWKGKDDKSFRLEDVVAGKYDHLLKHFAEGAKAFEKPIFVSFAHEMNGNWYPWSGNPALYKKAFQHVHDAIERAGAKNITWVWNPDIVSSAKEYYPGDKYVDWIAIDGYNTQDYGAPWRSCSELFSEKMTELGSLGKPIMIGEFASDANDHADETTRKPEFLSNCISHFAHEKQVKAFIYFNKDKVEEGQPKQWAVSAPEARKAYREAVKKYERSFRDQILTATCDGKELPPSVPAKVGPVVSEETYEQPEPAPGELDLELGEIRAEGIPRLHHLKVKEKVTLEKLDRILTALKQAPENRVIIVDDHQYSSQEFNKLYPELAEIERHDPRLYWYLRDFRAHWDNAILLLSIYTQKIVESTREDKDELLKNALEIAEGFRKRLRYQEMADKASGEKRGPSDYSLALLDLTLAEIYSQTENRDAGFYEKGIAMATSALHGLLYLEDKELFPSKPDYFVITKGILILGDLYQQLAHFTTDINQKQKYFEVAFQLYQSVSDLKASEGGSLSLHLDWLVVDPLLQKCKSVDLSQPYPAPLGFEITIDRALVEEALSFNFERGYIKSEDAEKALTGIFHYQKGVAMIKAAGLVAAWPRLKPIAEILYQIENLERGMAEINEAILRTGEDEKKIAFFSAFKKIVKGELLMALADRINFYQDKKAWGELQKHGEINQYIAKAKAKIVEDLWKTLKDNAEVSGYLPETLEELKRSRDPLKSVIPSIKNESLQQKGKDLSRWVELLRGGAAETEREQAELLTAVARDYYFSDIPREYKYLYAWAKVKQLEIAIRNATYVLETKQGKRYADATEPLKFCQENKELLIKIAKGKIPREYLNIEFDYLQTILNLASIPVRKNGRFVIERDETGKPSIKRIDLANQIFALNQPVEKDIQSLPPALTEYFKTYTQLKEVGALIQVRKRKKEKNQLILNRIKAKTGRELAPLDYALALLKDIEKRTAPALPPYLLHNLTVTLPERIKKNKDTREIITVTKLFVEQRIKEYAPAAYPKVREKVAALEKAVNQKNPAEVNSALKALKAELELLDASSKYEKKYAELLVWDQHSLRAELYHMLAVAYAIKGAGKPEGSPEGRILTQYAQSAYMESELSNNPYDYKYRRFFIFQGTDSFPDQDIPLLKGIMKRQPRKEKR